jgi:hypothetical protein
MLQGILNRDHDPDVFSTCRIANAIGGIWGVI